MVEFGETVSKKIKIIDQAVFFQIIESIDSLHLSISNGADRDVSLEKISDIKKLLANYDHAMSVTTINGRTSCVVSSDDVCVIETDGRFLKVHLQSGERYILSKMSFSDVVERWPGVFVRTNRNVMVNVNSINSLHKTENGFELNPRGYTAKIIVSRRNVKSIKDLLSKIC